MSSYQKNSNNTFENIRKEAKRHQRKEFIKSLFWGRYTVFLIALLVVIGFSYHRTVTDAYLDIENATEQSQSIATRIICNGGISNCTPDEKAIVLSIKDISFKVTEKELALVKDWNIQNKDEYTKRIYRIQSSIHEEISSINNINITEQQILDYTKGYRKAIEPDGFIFTFINSFFVVLGYALLFIIVALLDL